MNAPHALGILGLVVTGIAIGCGAGPRPPASATAASEEGPEARAQACLDRLTADAADLAAQACYREALTRLGRRDEVIGRAAAARALRTGDPRTWYVEALARLGPFPVQARRMLEQCVDRFTGDGLCAIGMAHLLLLQDDAASAAMYAERAKAADSPPALRLAIEARVAAAMSQPERALQAAEAAVAADAASPAAWVAMTEARIAAGQPDEASAAADRAASLSPDAPEPQFARGRVRLMLGDAPGAVGALTAALAADDQFHPGRRALAQALLGSGRPEAAARHLEWLVEHFPDETPYVIDLGEALLEAGQAGRALGWATLALAKSPDDVDALTLRARALIRVGQLEEAMALRPRLYADGPSVDRRIAIARALARSGRPELAEAEFAEAVAAEPGAEDVWRNYAGWHLTEGRADRAIAVLEQAVEVLPEAPLLRFDLAGARERAGDRDGARAAMKRAAALDPNDPDYEDELARLEFVSGEVDHAVDRWQRLAQRWPQADRARVRLSLALRMLGRHAEATTLLSEVAKRHPDDPELLMRLGEAMLLAGNKTEAVPVLERALARGAEDRSVRPLLAAAQADTGAFDAADRNFRKALEGDPGNRPLRLTYARFLEARRQPEAAEKQYAALLSRDPDDAGAAEALRRLLGDDPNAERRMADTRVRRAAAADPELAKLAARAPSGPVAEGALGAVLRDERYVTVDAKGVASIRMVRSILVRHPLGVDRYTETSVSFHDGRRPTIVRARTLTPDGQEIPLRDDDVRVVDPHDGTPLYGDTRRLVLRFPRLEPGAIADYEVEIPRPQAEALGVWWDAYVLGNVDPTVRVRYQLSVPEGAAHSVAAPGLPEPERATGDGRVRLTWTRMDLPAFDLGAPGGPERGAVPAVYASGHRSWGEVDAWYHRLFAPAATADEGVRQRAREVTKDARTRRERVAAVYQFVEHHVRYLGLELGIEAYRPRAAALTLARGVGDCKDMTALMVAMLDAIGIPAYPALIRPWDQGPFIETHPSPGQFSHVLLYVPDPEGDLWLDATSGMGTVTAVPDVLRLRKAFVVDGEGGRLVGVPGGDADVSRLEEEALYRLQPTGGGELSTTVRLTGDSAGELRQRLLALDEEERKALLGAPGYVLGGTRSPTALQVGGLDDPGAPVVVTARLKHPDLVGVRLDGGLVLPFFVDVIARGPLPVIRDGHHVPSPRTYARRLRIEVPAGYRFAWQPLTYDGGDQTVRLRVRETREARATVIETRVVVRGSTRSAENAVSLESALLEASHRLEERLVMLPGDDFDPVALLRAIVAEKPEDPRLWTLLGRSLLERSRLTDAIEALQTAWRLGPGDVQTGALLGTALLRAERFEQAFDTFRELAALPDPPTEVFLALSGLHLRAQRPEQALGALREGVSRRPADAELGRRLLVTLTAAGRHEEALAEARKQARQRPDDATVQALLGDLASNHGEHETAESAYRAALKAMPNDARVVNNLAWMLREVPARRTEALALARRAVELDPKMPAAWDTLAELLFLGGDPQAALEAIDRALALQPVDRSAYEARRRQYESRGALKPRGDAPAAAPAGPAPAP